MWLYFLFLLGCTPQNSWIMNDLPCQVIVELDLGIRSKRPDKNGPAQVRYALIETCRPASDLDFVPQRQVLSLHWQGQVLRRELIQVLTVFPNKTAALAYARQEQKPIEVEGQLRYLPNDCWASIYWDKLSAHIQFRLSVSGMGKYYVEFPAVEQPQDGIKRGPVEPNNTYSLRVQEQEIHCQSPLYHFIYRQGEGLLAEGLSSEELALAQALYAYLVELAR
jgi:hypothetical protein